MNCPDCGNRIIFEDNDSSCECELPNKIICDKCGFVIATIDKNGMYKYWNDVDKQPEPTPEEMLMWLVKHNFSIQPWHDEYTRISNKSIGIEEISTLPKVIKVAYLKAKEKV